jgi:hypothetical protein
MKNGRNIYELEKEKKIFGLAYFSVSMNRVHWIGYFWPKISNHYSELEFHG